MGTPALALLLGAGGPGCAAADVFNTEAAVSQNPAAPALPGIDEPCRLGPLSVPLSLFDAIERSLCESPKTRSAWAGVKAAAAGLGAAKSAYLPTLDGSASAGQLGNRTEVTGPQRYRTDYSEGVNVEALQLSWVLFDFGGRSAAVKNGHQLLLAARATQDAVLQAAFVATARDYYAAQAAAARLESARAIEAGAQKNLAAAGERRPSGAVPESDRLQADTAYAQAVYERAAAEGAYRLALGALAVDMSLPPDESLTLPQMESGALPDASFVHAVHDLLEEAGRDHPAVLAAKASWQAALDNIQVVRAEGMPKVALAGSLERYNGPLNPTVGTLNYPSVSRSRSIGVTLQVPLFSGFNQSYKVRQAEAQADTQEQALRDTQQQVALSVWTQYQMLQSATENLKNAERVAHSADQAFAATSQRYQSSAGSAPGNILELLNSQGMLAGAQAQRIQAQFDWRTARLALAQSLGSLGIWAIKQGD